MTAPGASSLTAVAFSVGDSLPLLASTAIAAATPWGLVAWVRGVGARSVEVAAPEPASTVVRRLLPMVALQVACGWSALGIAGGLFHVAAAWMLVGWIFQLALNLAPARTLAVSRGLGLTGIAACAVAIALSVVARSGPA